MPSRKYCPSEVRHWLEVHEVTLTSELSPLEAVQCSIRAGEGYCAGTSVGFCPWASCDLMPSIMLVVVSLVEDSRSPSSDPGRLQD